MIEAINISKYYLVQRRKKDVFNNVSLLIKPGERVGFMGRNGAGKSTILRLLCGIEKPSSGTIRITSRLSWPVGVASGVVPTLTGKENVKFVCRLFTASMQQAQEILEFVEAFSELGDYINMPVQTYSSGMRSRLAFAMSMAFDFDFYIVDEAFAVGDAAFKKKCQAMFKERAKNKGIIIVSHSPGMLREFCDRGIYLHQAGLTQSDDIEEIIKLYQSQTA